MWQRPRAPPGGLYGEDENVPGRATMKLRSIEIQRQSKDSPGCSPGLHNRSPTGMLVAMPSGPARALGPPQPLRAQPLNYGTPPPRQWKLTDDMMSQPWGSVLRSLNR